MALITVTVADFGLGAQAWAGPDEPDPNRSLRPMPTPGPRPKPHDGFFTSTWDVGRRSSAWLDFMRVTGERGPEDRMLWVLTPQPEATLYVIDSLADYKRLADEYPQRWNHPNVSSKNPDYAPNWNQIATAKPLPFDGMHATEAGIQAGNVQPPGDPRFTGWDVESTLWFAWRFIKHELVGVIYDGWTLRKE